MNQLCTYCIIFFLGGTVTAQNEGPPPADRLSFDPQDCVSNSADGMLFNYPYIYRDEKYLSQLLTSKEYVLLNGFLEHVESQKVRDVLMNYPVSSVISSEASNFSSGGSILSTTGVLFLGTGTVYAFSLMGAAVFAAGFSRDIDWLNRNLVQSAYGIGAGLIFVVAGELMKLEGRSRYKKALNSYIYR